MRKQIESDYNSIEQKRENDRIETFGQLKSLIERFNKLGQQYSSNFRRDNMGRGKSNSIFENSSKAQKESVDNNLTHYIEEVDAIIKEVTSAKEKLLATFSEIKGLIEQLYQDIPVTTGLSIMENSRNKAIAPTVTVPSTFVAYEAYFIRNEQHEFQPLLLDAKSKQLLQDLFFLEKLVHQQTSSIPDAPELNCFSQMQRAYRAQLLCVANSHFFHERDNREAAERFLESANKLYDGEADVIKSGMQLFPERLANNSVEEFSKFAEAYLSHVMEQTNNAAKSLIEVSHSEPRFMKVEEEEKEGERTNGDEDIMLQYVQKIKTARGWLTEISGWNQHVNQLIQEAHHLKKAMAASNTPSVQATITNCTDDAVSSESSSTKP